MGAEVLGLRSRTLPSRVMGAIVFPASSLAKVHFKPVRYSSPVKRMGLPTPGPIEIALAAPLGLMPVAGFHTPGAALVSNSRVLKPAGTVTEVRSISAGTRSTSTTSVKALLAFCTTLAMPLMV
ncbi:hypothetical protein D3C81_1392500 [compost metagenome]